MAGKPHPDSIGDSIRPGLNTRGKRSRKDIDLDFLALKGERYNSAGEQRDANAGCNTEGLVRGNRTQRDKDG
jgi:hypothetical protein